MQTNQPFHFTTSGTTNGTVAKSFLANTFALMFAGLSITALVAFYFASDVTLLSHLIKEDGRGLNLLGYIVMFAPLGFVLIMSFALNRLSYIALLGLFIAYAAINGISFSFIFLAYTSASIFKTFAITAGMFGLMAVLGYTTKKDLTSFGSLMMMGLFGIIIASLVNFFVHSSTLDYIISYVGVMVFVGLTAYDVQKLKNIGMQVEGGSATAGKLSVMGALTLYLDFVNLFLMLLRIFGGKRD